MRSAARLRDRRVLDAQIAALREQARCSGRNGAVCGGALDALVWLVRGGPAPLTGVLAGLPVASEIIEAELVTAEHLATGRPSQCRDYARGVQHAVRWAQHATANPPLQIPAADPAAVTTEDSAPRVDSDRSARPPTHGPPQRAGERQAGEHDQPS